MVTINLRSNRSKLTKPDYELVERAYQSMAVLRTHFPDRLGKQTEAAEKALQEVLVAMQAELDSYKAKKD